MSWIKVIPFAEATGRLKAIYQKVKGPKDQIDNILSIHSLRPHTLIGHMSLYKNALHHNQNSFPNWFLEFLGTYTSFINRCDYCFDHHFEGMRRFLNDDDKAANLRMHIEQHSLDSFLSQKEYAMVKYAQNLTLQPGAMQESQIKVLKELGYDDGEILEANQVIAYFNYANRTVLGLGVDAGGEVLGMSPKNKDDEDSWGHE